MLAYFKNKRCLRVINLHLKIIFLKLEHQAGLSKRNSLQFFRNRDVTDEKQHVSDDDVIIIEQNDNTTKNISAKTYICNENLKTAKLRLYKGQNLTANENSEDINYKKGKINARDSSEVEPENSKKNKFQLKVILKMQVHDFINIFIDNG